MLPFSVVATAQGDAFSYFSRCLATGNVTAAPAGRKLTTADVEGARQRLWTLWAKAVKDMPGPHLPPIAPLDSVAPDYLPLPDSLERNAVMPYYWGSKGEIADAANASAPTFVYLHGSGPKAAEWSAGRQWAMAFADAPSRYVIPQIPQEGEYYRWWQRAKLWAYRRLWMQMTATAGIDPNRVCLVGISEGGYGSQRLASFYADYLAAAGPMAGGEPLINAPAENLEHVGFSLLTGARDDMFCRNVYTMITAEALDSLQREHPEGYAHRVRLIPDRGHGFDYRPTTPWLMQFRRNPWPHRFVWEDFEMDGVHRQGFYNLRVDRRPCDSLRTRYDVAIGADGHINITVRNVHYEPTEKEDRWGFTLRWRKTYVPASGGELTLFLDEHLVDLSKKVTVTVNGVKVFAGKLKLNTACMMESLATFADPMRIYPAALTLAY